MLIRCQQRHHHSFCISWLLQGTLEQPQGWLEGRNQRSGQEGLFPGTYVEFVKAEKVPAEQLRQPHKKPPVTPRPDKHIVDEYDDSGYCESPSGKCGSFSSFFLKKKTGKN